MTDKSTARKLVNDGLYSSSSDMWGTPQKLFDNLNKRYEFQLDVCAIAENAKCASYYSPEVDGLSQDWNGVLWMNPPYGRGIIHWMKKAYESSRDNGATVVCLVPSRTDTKWWHEYGMKGEIHFIKGRLKFGDGENVAPFPSAIIIYGGDSKAGTVRAVNKIGEFIEE